MDVECHYIWCRFNRKFCCTRKNIAIGAGGLCLDSRRAEGEELLKKADDLAKMAGIAVVEEKNSRYKNKNKRK